MIGCINIKKLPRSYSVVAFCNTNSKDVPEVLLSINRKSPPTDCAIILLSGSPKPKPRTVYFYFLLYKNAQK